MPPDSGFCKERCLQVRWFAAFLAAALLLHTSAAVCAADLLLTNGKVITLDAQSRVAQAIAISGNRILAVGTNAEAQSKAAPDARRIDLGGRTVIPGLIDSHIHAIRAGVRHATEVSWIGADTIDEAMGRLRAAAAATSPDTWIIVAGGWTPQQFSQGRRPNHEEISAASPGRRVYIQLFYRAAYLSPEARRAIDMVDEAGIPAGAKPEGTTGDRPTGWLLGDTASITGIYERLPKPTLAQSMEGTRRYFAELNRFGITGVIDPGGHNLAPEEYEALMRLAHAGELTARVSYSISAPRPGKELEDLQTLTRFASPSTSDAMLRFNGIGERVTWGLYNNDHPSDSQKDAFVALATWAAERGLSLTAHWNNDRSAHHLLDVLERVNRTIPIQKLRWSIAHLHDASEPTLTRMKALGVGWIMQNGLYFAAPSYLAARGNSIAGAPALKTGLRIGLRIGGGTDANRVMSHNPFVSLRWMTDGRTVDGLPTRGAAELISREEALRLYTQGSAWFDYSDHNRGSLAAGFLADLAVLDRDYFDVSSTDLSQTRALLTIVNGRIVHADTPFPGPSSRPRSDAR